MEFEGKHKYTMMTTTMTMIIMKMTRTMAMMTTTMIAFGILVSIWFKFGKSKAISWILWFDCRFWCLSLSRQKRDNWTLIYQRYVI